MGNPKVTSGVITLKDQGGGVWGSAPSKNDYYEQPVPLDDPNAFFIASTGSDSNDGKLVEFGGTGPWATIAYAWAQMMPSNVLYYMDIITIPASLDMKFTGTNAATLSTPVIHTRHPDVDFGAAGLDFTNGGISRFDQKHYWWFQNLVVNNCGGAFAVGQDITSTGAKWKLMSFNMNRGGDNAAALAFQGTADDYIVEDVTIIGPGYDGGVTINQNTACIWMTRTERCTINRVTLKNAPIPFYHKHENEDSLPEDVTATISNVFIDEYGRNPAQINARYFSFDNWVIGKNGVDSSISVSNDNGVPGGVGCTFDHFTIYNRAIKFNSSAQSPPGAIDNTITNTVTQNAITSGLDTVTLNITSNNNAFGDALAAYHIQTVDKPLATWQAESGQDLSSIDGVLIFVGGANPVDVGDYALAPGSIGFGTGVGADTSQVGSRV